MDDRPPYAPMRIREGATRRDDNAHAEAARSGASGTDHMVPRRTAVVTVCLASRRDAEPGTDGASGRGGPAVRDPGVQRRRAEPVPLRDARPGGRWEPRRLVLHPARPGRHEPDRAG